MESRDSRLNLVSESRFLSQKKRRTHQHEHKLPLLQPHWENPKIDFRKSSHRSEKERASEKREEERNCNLFPVPHSQQQQQRVGEMKKKSDFQTLSHANPKELLLPLSFWKLFASFSSRPKRACCTKSIRGHSIAPSRFLSAAACRRLEKHRYLRWKCSCILACQRRRSGCVRMRQNWIIELNFAFPTFSSADTSISTEHSRSSIMMFIITEKPLLSSWHKTTTIIPTTNDIVHTAHCKRNSNDNSFS